MAIAPEAPKNEPEPAAGATAPAEPTQPTVEAGAQQAAPAEEAAKEQPEPEQTTEPVVEPNPDTAGAAAAAAKAAVVAAVVSADPNLVSTTVALPTDALEFLRAESGRNGTSTGDELRRAIGTQKFLLDKIGEGAVLQLRDAKGNLFDVKI